MRARWMWSVVGAAALAWSPVCGAQDEEAVAAAEPAATAPAQAGAAGMYRIAGTVLSAQDGHPLRHATVRIYASGRPGAAQTVTADDSGQFEFAGVAAGKFVLEGSAQGFVTATYEQHGNFNTGIVTGAGVNTESLVLALEPQSTISVRVTDESGDPVERAQVRLFRKSLDAGSERPVPAQGGTTNDQGRWESPGLMPGEYYVVVQATPWYAVHPMQTQPQVPVGVVESIQPALDVAYPITYYPAATEESGATPVEVRGGGTVELSMQLRPEPALSISVPAPAPVNPDQMRNGAPPPVPMFTQVTTKVFGQVQFVQAMQSQNGDRMLIGGLAPGQYDLQRARANGGDEGPVATVRLTDHSIAADPENDSSGVHVTAELRAVDGSRVGRPTQLLVMRNGEVYRRVTVDQRGAASFDIEPGDYRFDVEGGARSLNVRQVLVNEKPVAGNRVHVAAGGTTAYVVEVVPGSHTLQGVVQRDGKPVASVFVLMIPTADLKDPQTFYRDQSDLDGSFQLRGIAPGDYTLFAVQHGWEVDWHKAATYDAYREHATPVHVGDTAGAVVKVETVVAQAR